MNLSRSCHLPCLWSPSVLTLCCPPCRRLHWSWSLSRFSTVKWWCSFLYLVWCLASCCLARFVMPMGADLRWFWGWAYSVIAIGADNFEQMGQAQGLGAAGPKIVCRAVIRDRCEGAAIARVMSLVFTAFILVPMIAPMIGQGLLLVAGWRWIFCLYLFWAGTARLWFMIR